MLLFWAIPLNLYAVPLVNISDTFYAYAHLCDRWLWIKLGSIILVIGSCLLSVTTFQIVLVFFVAMIHMMET